MLYQLCQLHEARAERMADLDKADVVLDRRGVLEPEENSGPALAAGAAHILAGATLENQFGITLEPAVPLLDIRHHLAKGLVIGNGDVNGVDAALAHLPEDLFRPVAILEAVDHMHLRTYEAGPVEI